MKNFFLIAMILMVAILQSCTSDPFPDQTHKSKINIKINTKSLQLSGTPVSKVRIIAYHKGESKIKLNTTSLIDNSTVSGVGSFFFSIPLGEYSFYAIVNEPDNLTAQLNAVTSESALNSITIQPAAPFTETTVMLTKKRDVKIDINASEETTVDGSTDPLLMELERVYTKVSLKITKKTAEEGDKIIIKKVDFMQSPEYSYLNAKIYDKTTYVSREMFSGSMEIAANDTKNEIIKEITTDSEPSNIFAEYLLADADKSKLDKASHLSIVAQYTPKGGSPRDVYYQIPVGDYNGGTDINGASNVYDLKRNHHYAIDATITKMGETDAVVINYAVKPWENESLDIEIVGDPFLDVSNVEVDVYDAAATRIYFYSNMPEVVIDPALLNGTQSIPVNDVFESLAGMAPTNFKYTYDISTQRGEGYLDLINIDTEEIVRQQRKLYLKSGKLVREITAMTRISAEAARQDTLPFVGTFHRYAERGERIVSWHLPTTTRWKVEVVTDNTFDNGVAGASYYDHAKSFLRIDHLASPNHSKLYTLEPPSAEGAFVMEEAVGGPIRKIEGRGRVYFRVGWSNVLSSAKEHRFAKIKVTTSIDDFASEKVRFIYCRQGEDPIAIVSKSTVFASYNISTPETFVDFPTKSGYLYQWNSTIPWAVTGALPNYSIGDVSDISNNKGYEYKTYINESYICPAKYSYPDNGALTVMEAALNPTNVMYQWGYYADGFFDRRAVSEHLVRNAVGEIASAGGLFYSGSTAIAIFLPTASWRDYEGKVNNLLGHQDLGVIGHYWSWAQDGEWTTGGGGTPNPNATLEAKALHLTRRASPDSYLESLNKASAASVRCMRLGGETIYFDANGGLTTPRSMTVKTGTSITIPQGPQHSDPVFGFVHWASTRGGTAPTHLAGATVLIDTEGDRTLYAQYRKIYNIGDKVLVVSNVDPSEGMNYDGAVAICGATIDGHNDWRLPTVIEIPELYKVISGLVPAGLYLWASKEGDTYSRFFVTGGKVYKFDVKPETNDKTKVRCVRELN